MSDYTKLKLNEISWGLYNEIMNDLHQHLTLKINQRMKQHNIFIKPLFLISD